MREAIVPGEQSGRIPQNERDVHGAYWGETRGGGERRKGSRGRRRGDACRVRKLSHREMAELARREKCPGCGGQGRRAFHGKRPPAYC